MLLSHLHHDHAELSSLRLLPGVPILTHSDNARWLRRKGLDGQGLAEGEWASLGTDQQVAGRLVRADHHSRRMPHRPNAANGHLVRGRGGTAWFAGDTSLFAEMTSLPQLAGGALDVALVPIGGWGPRLSPGHMGPEEAAVACRLSGARHAIPVHWRTLHVPFGRSRPRGWMDAAGPRFLAALDAEAPECVPLVLDVGGSVTVPGDGSKWH